jgi:hypothetical protein
MVLLVKARINPGISVPDKDTWRQGDIVACFPTGHVFGGLEGLPNFYQVEVADVTHGQAQNITCCDYFLTDGLPTSLNRSRWNFWDDVPSARQATLNATGKLQVSRANLLTWACRSSDMSTKLTAGDLDIPPPESPAP